MPTDQTRIGHLLSLNSGLTKQLEEHAYTIQNKRIWQQNFVNQCIAVKPESKSEPVQWVRPCFSSMGLSMVKTRKGNLICVSILKIDAMGIC